MGPTCFLKQRDYNANAQVLQRRQGKRVRECAVNALVHSAVKTAHTVWGPIRVNNDAFRALGKNVQKKKCFNF